MNKEINMDIEVGDYVKTKRGKIDRVTNNKFYIKQYIDCERDLYLRENIVKHSKNIIDLIEVGDFVNGNRVVDKYLYAGEKPVLETVGIKYNAYCLSEGDIREILTKEQYIQNCYTVERTKKC